jgi:hypothetical protein
MRSIIFCICLCLCSFLLSACGEPEPQAYTGPRPPREPYVPEYEPYLALSPPIYIADASSATDEICIGFVFTNPANETLIVSFVKEGESNQYQICTGAMACSDKNAELVPFGSNKEADILETLKFYLTTYHNNAELIKLYNSYPPTQALTPRQRCASEMLHAMSMNKKARSTALKAAASKPQ